MLRLRRLFRDLSLNAKVTWTLVAAFASIVSVFLVVLVPFLREHRARLLEKDKRLLSTLRETYQRDLIYDLLSENEESLAAHLGDLAGQPGLLWARLEAGDADLAATGDRRVIGGLLGAEAEPYDDEPGLVLLVRADGRGHLTGTGGRMLLGGRSVPREAMPDWPGGARGSRLEEMRWRGQAALYYATGLDAADESFGRLHLLYSLADVERAQTLTRNVFYAVVGSSFVLVLLLLNLLISRIVIHPVKNVQRAMSQAATGELDVVLPVHARDELGAMGEAFNRMVAELSASKKVVEEYSRTLEARVAERTRALRESEAGLLDFKNRLSTVIANVGTGVIALDDEGRIETFNERAAQILAVTRPVLGNTLAEVLEGDARRIVDRIEPVRRRSLLRDEAQLVCQLPQGRRTLSIVASALPGEGGRGGTVVVCDDLTEILATQRLGAWKEAVERVIHEIKNPLTPVALAAETLQSAHRQDRARFDALFPSAIDMVLSSVRDLKALIAEFGRFSRLPEVRLEPCRLNELVGSALAPYVNGGVAGPPMQVELAAGELETEADPDQLRRVLLNVVNNALEAMEGRSGKLRVATSREDREVVISVADSGPGVEDVERIFEPYYTTKVKGTGLGLAIARQIVEEHHGRITVESQLGVGTTVRIRLPVREA
ncbi:MAG TPA: ATP-binding protein [Vicinamibacteria bacterium]|nr:ATP-binding protein [Vicinamibacteria bacterium]